MLWRVWTTPLSFHSIRYFFYNNSINIVWYNLMPEESLNDTLELGGSIVLSGFRAIDGASMVILKKVIGNYVKRMSERAEKFEQLALTVKPIHQNESSKKFELNAKLLDNGKVFNSEFVDKNIFIAVDSALKKLESERFRQ